MDESSFVRLVEPHITELLRVAAVLVGTADAEDATQEATVRAWRGWADLRESGAVRAWLLRITLNVCHSWNNGHYGTRRRMTAPLDDETLTALRLPGIDPGDSDHARALDLYAAIDALPPDLRTAIMLRYFVGLDATEIGTIMDIPPGTIRARLRRALHTLRLHLAPASQQQKGAADV
ncbi:MAG TPA: RNA polymerase sigma factor [Ktedonobacterales bacterium]|nr:RNA polymerase sigma factor [Ktedonobacterales bacterium]